MQSCISLTLSLDRNRHQVSVPLSALGARRFTVTLRGGDGFTDDGYRGRTAGAIELTFTHGPVSQQITREP